MITRGVKVRAISTVRSVEPPSTTTISSHQATLLRQCAMPSSSFWQTIVQLSVGLAPAGTAGIGAMAGNWTSPNPPFGAVLTYNVKQAVPDDAKLVITIADDNGRQIRRLEVDKTPGLRRVAWNLRGEPVANAAPTGRGGGGGFGGRGGPPLGPLVTPGHYRATLGKLVGETVTPLGPSQSFSVVALTQ